MKWWLFSKQKEYNDNSFSYLAVFILYIVVVVICIGIRAVTWPGNKHVDIDFLIDAVLMPTIILTTVVQFFCMIANGLRHYTETRLLIAARQEYNVVSYARGYITLAGWSVLTPTADLALNMLKLEGEFPLAPKMPLKIDLAESFDLTRNGQAFFRLIAPLVDKLKSPQYKGFEAAVWINGGDESCCDELQRVFESFAITGIKMTYLPECPDYTLLTEWITQAKNDVFNRLLICIDLHPEEEESKRMENATAFFFTNSYVKTEGEKPVYLYQPMTGVTDVENNLPVYLRTEPVSKPKILWYTGLSRTEKYPLLEVLDEKKMVPERLELETSFGERSAGYQWLALAMASDAVRYAQGDQLVVASEHNKCAITALSSRLTRQPDYPQEKIYPLPWSAGGIAGLMLFFSLAIGFSCFGDDKMVTGGFIVFLFFICLAPFLVIGAFFTWFFGEKAHEHMWGE
ncbi:hypothetical protein ACP26E_07950 [Franconibacter pulveris 601]|uniref:hypothetical protein n=1 Tax=Franconibacter pulveris TaxID=435910 RepID=UPI000467C773|nr:hypothetical protein [Franconibacter pulveris]